MRQLASRAAMDRGHNRHDGSAILTKDPARLPGSLSVPTSTPSKEFFDYAETAAEAARNFRGAAPAFGESDGSTRPSLAKRGRTS